MTNKYDYEDEDDDDDEDLPTKETRKRRIKNKRKFKKRWFNNPKKMNGFIQNKPRNHNWKELMEDEDDSYDKTS